MEASQSNKYLVLMYAVICIAFIYYLYRADKRAKEVDQALLKSLNQDHFIKEQFIEKNTETPPTNPDS